MTRNDLPARPVTVKDYHVGRRRGRALLAVATGALGFQEAVFLWIWMMAGITFPPPPPVLVMVAAPAVFLAFFWTLAGPTAFRNDVEMADGMLRLPFRRHRSRRGWRRIDEVLLLAIRPDPDALAQARARFGRIQARGPRRWAYRLRIAEWAKWGGLLAITQDEIVWLRESFEALRFLDEHWRAGDAN